MHGEDSESGRKKAIYEVGLTYGAQSGLHWKMANISSYLDQEAQKLDQIYNFNFLLMKHNVLPPVVANYGKTYTIESDDTVRLSDYEIKMVKPARFVSVAPSWRNYIYLSYPKPEAPPERLLPQDPDESEIWVEATRKGWEQGVSQAASIFQTGLSRLNQDFQGMVLYKQMYLQNMISAPYTETTNLGVTGDSSGLRLNDKIIKITRPSLLNPQTNQWYPIILQKSS